MPNQNTPFVHRSSRLMIAVALVFVVVLAGLSPTTADASREPGSVVVANRGSGDLSVIDTSSLAVSTVALPGDGAEPMYVSHDARHGRVLVGDRGSSTIVAFDDSTYDVVGSVNVGDGVFHQWIDVDREQLWVVGTAESTVSVIDTANLNLLTTFALPADVIADGGVAHDVFVEGNNAFVSVLSVSDGTGLVIQYSTKTFDETGRISTGADPHLFVRGGKLYVASQDASSVSRFQANTLAPLGSVSIPAAHGLFVTHGGDVYVTNIAGGGADALWALDSRLSAVADIADTNRPVPHNLTVDDSGQLWVTHSGATSDQVSVVGLDADGFGQLTEVTVGINPFGLAFVG